ncbi:hypothetical protein KQ306_08420 [Synechococcus sp. CS-1324]|nr:hypothetical protein [Synechococcus sp. CS-1324]MCT0230873.1 hypothetical protein [Synechococcus sp. CS-1324]
MDDGGLTGTVSQQKVIDSAAAPGQQNGSTVDFRGADSVMLKSVMLIP